MTRNLLFSSVYDLLSQVVFKIKPSVHAAYQDKEEERGASLVAVYDKLKGIEPHTSAELVRYSATEFHAIIDELGGRRDPWLPGYRVKILDGNCIESTEHRIKELREITAGALPGKSLVVFDPALGMVIDVFACEDGHAQERSLLTEVLPSVEAGDVWIDDRNFCVCQFLCETDEKEAFFITREHQGLAWEAVSSLLPAGRTETGELAEQRIRVVDAEGEEHIFRRIRVKLKQPTRDGDTIIYILTNLPRSVAKAKKIAELYRRRWTIETAFQEVEAYLHSEINTLGYPKAALFGFCMALVAYSTLAMVFAALRAVHGEAKIDQEISNYYVANEIAEVHRGMMIAIPTEQGVIFSNLSVSQLVTLLKELAAKVRLRAFRKHPRGPKKPRIKRKSDPKTPHVSTAKLLMNKIKRPCISVTLKGLEATTYQAWRRAYNPE